MRTSRSGIILLLGVLLLLSALVLPRFAYAAREQRVKTDFTCWLVGQISGLAEDIQTEDGHSVVTRSGNTKLTCHFTYNGTDLPGNAIIIRNFPCTVYGDHSDNPTYLETTNSQVVITPSGNVQMTCHMNGQEPATLGISGIAAP